MARPVPADLENALSANPAARASFAAMSSEQKDAWVAWIERPRFSHARRRRVAEAVQRIGGGVAVRETEVVEPAPVALPRDDWWMWFLGLALLAGLAAFLVWLTVYRHHGSHAAAAGTVVVPNVVGRSSESARLQLRSAKLDSVLVHAATATPKGIVASQTPEPGASVPAGTQVTLVVSTGPLLQASTTTVTTTTAATTTVATTTAPAAPTGGNDYTGLRLRQAIQKIVSGRQQAIVDYTTSGRPVGVVVANSTAGSRERLQVSAGATPQPLTSVPDVTGEDAATAVQDLQTAGFTVIQAKWPVSDSTRFGQVVYETPLGGRQAPRGSAIALYVGAA